MDLLERRRMMMSAGGGWKTYTLTNYHSSGQPTDMIDTGIRLYNMSEWELTATFTIDFPAGIVTNQVLFINANSTYPTVRLVRSSSGSTTYLGSMSTSTSGYNKTLTLTASWNKDDGGNATLIGSGINLSSTIAKSYSRYNTSTLILLRYLRNVIDVPTGTIHSLTIRYKE